MVGSHHEGSALKRPRLQTDPASITVVSSGDEEGEEQAQQQRSTRSPYKVNAGPATVKNDQHEQGTFMLQTARITIPEQSLIVIDPSASY